MKNIRREIWTFTKAEMSAFAASWVDFGMAILLTYSGPLSYGYANIIGVVSGGAVNFTLNSQYVFSKTGRAKQSLAVRYLLVWLGSMFLNGCGTNLLTWLVGGKSYFVFVKALVALCVAFCFNYPLQRGWVFRKRDIADVD